VVSGKYPFHNGAILIRCAVTYNRNLSALDFRGILKRATILETAYKILGRSFLVLWYAVVLVGVGVCLMLALSFAQSPPLLMASIPVASCVLMLLLLMVLLLGLNIQKVCDQGWRTVYGKAFKFCAAIFGAPALIVLCFAFLALLSVDFADFGKLIGFGFRYIFAAFLCTSIVSLPGSILYLLGQLGRSTSTRKAPYSRGNGGGSSYFDYDDYMRPRA
jgi:hypothetical protein